MNFVWICSLQWWSIFHSSADEMLVSAGLDNSLFRDHSIRLSGLIAFLLRCFWQDSYFCGSISSLSLYHCLAPAVLYIISMWELHCISIDLQLLWYLFGMIWLLQKIVPWLLCVISYFIRPHVRTWWYQLNGNNPFLAIWPDWSRLLPINRAIRFFVKLFG